MLGITDEEGTRLTLSLEIAADAQRAAVQFWRAWLWQSREMSERPTSAFCLSLGERFGVSTAEIYRQWLEWYSLLTSWDLAAALVGRDVRSVTIAYGVSHRRT